VNVDNGAFADDDNDESCHQPLFLLLSFPPNVRILSITQYQGILHPRRTSYLPRCRSPKQSRRSPVWEFDLVFESPSDSRCRLLIGSRPGFRVRRFPRRLWTLCQCLLT
jgi:hypothetical protein